MRHVIVAFIALMLAVSTAAADYVTLDFVRDAGGGNWGWNYQYHRDPVPETVGPGDLDVGGTWEIDGIVQPINLGTPNEWPTSEILPGGARFTYGGNDLPGPDATYGYFDILVQQETRHGDLVPYEIDLDGDGVTDATGDVLAPTPEPGTLALAAIGLCAIAARVRRRRDD